MLNILKYDFYRKRKGLLISVILFAFVELLLIGSIFLIKEHAYLSVIPILLFYLFFYGIMIYICVDAVLTFSTDLSKKHGYMLFLTPTNAYTIISAKLIYSTIIYVFFILLTAVFIYVDIQVIIHVFSDEAKLIFEELSAPFEMFKQQFLSQFLIIGLGLILNWLNFLLMVYFSIALRKTLFSNTKLGWLISIGFFIGISTIYSIIQTAIWGMAGYFDELNNFIQLAYTNPDAFEITVAENPFALFDFKKYQTVSNIVQICFASVFFYLTGRLMNKRIDL